MKLGVYATCHTCGHVNSDAWQRRRSYIELNLLVGLMCVCVCLFGVTTLTISQSLTHFPLQFQLRLGYVFGTLS